MMTPAEIDQIALRVADLVAEKLSSRPVDGLIGKDEAAALLGCSVPTIERLTRSGAIPSHKVGKLRRYRAIEILTARKVGGAL
jgi:excisionase family DNA binding protein